jgi:ABC-2 type transport system ATP-binding protein
MPSRQAIVSHVHTLVKQQELAVLWATHLIDEIAEEDSLIVLDKGVIKAQGKLTAVLQDTGAANAAEVFSQLTQGGRSA